MNKTIKDVTVVGGTLAVVGAFRWFKRKYRHVFIQVRANGASPNNQPASEDKSLVKVEKVLTPTKIPEGCKEVVLNKEDAIEYIDKLSQICGESSKILLTKSAFSGLLKCDIPVSSLCKVNGIEGQYRGFAMNNGKIVEQGKFTSAGIGGATPLLAFQLASFVTGQYYMHHITCQLNDIKKGLDELKNYVNNRDLSVLENAFTDFEAYGRNYKKYRDSDVNDVKNTWNKVRVIRDTYLKNLSEKNYNVDFSFWSNRIEVKRKINKLYASGFEKEYMIALFANYLYFVGIVLLYKINESIHHEDAIKYYAGLLTEGTKIQELSNLLYKTRHNILGYLEAQRVDSSDSRYINVNNRFKSLEDNYKKIEMAEHLKMTQYIEKDQDGNIKLYLHLPALAAYGANSVNYK